MLCGGHVMVPSRGRAAKDKTPLLASSTVLQRKVHDVVASPGEVMDTASRAFFEPRFGYDFSQVRVHTDPAAAASARAVNASAYTLGRHVVFDSGRYDARSQGGRALLGHEL